MRRILFISLLVLVGCGIDVLEDEFNLPEVEDIVVMKESRVLTRSASDMDIEFDFSVIQAKFRFDGLETAEETIEDILVPYDDLESSTVGFNLLEGERYRFTIDDMILNAGSGNTSQQVSLGIMLDASENKEDFYAPYGYKNRTLEGIIGTIKLADENKEFLVAKSRREGAQNDAIELLTNGFESYSEELAVDIALIPRNQTGFAPLHDGIMEMIDLIADNASYEEKHLLVYTYSFNDGSINGYTPDDIVAHANARGVKVSIIWYTDSGISDWRIVAKVPLKTGGFSAYTRDSDQVTTVFLKAFELFNDELPFYTLKTAVYDSNMNISEPMDYQNYFRIDVLDENTDGKGSRLRLLDPVIYHFD